MVMFPSMRVARITRVPQYNFALYDDDDYEFVRAKWYVSSVNVWLMSEKSQTKLSTRG